MCLNSGYFVTETGSSSIFTAVLDREMVLEAKQQEHHSVIDEELYKRTVGGAMHHGFAGISKFAKNMHPMKEIHNMMNDEEGGKHRRKVCITKSKLHKLLR